MLITRKGDTPIRPAHGMPMESASHSLIGTSWASAETESAASCCFHTREPPWQGARVSGFALDCAISPKRPPPGHLAVPLGERLPQRAPTAEEIVGVVDDDGVRHELGFRSERCDRRPVP